MPCGGFYEIRINLEAKSFRFLIIAKKEYDLFFLHDLHLFCNILHIFDFFLLCFNQCISKIRKFGESRFIPASNEPSRHACMDI